MTRLPAFAFLIFILSGAPARAQDERCEPTPEPQCRCACKEVRTAMSFAPRGTCRVIETGGGSCQLRWVDAARGDQKLPDEAGAIQRTFLDRVREGSLPTNARGSLMRANTLIELIRSRGIRLPVGPTPLEAAAAYLALEPEKLEPEPLLASYLIMLGPAVEQIAGEKAAVVLVDYFFSELKTILERLQSMSSPERRQYKSENLVLVDDVTRGCLELTITNPKPMVLMVKSPRAGVRARCRE